MLDFDTRRNIRLVEFNYRERNCYFVTFCCFGRQPKLRDPQLSKQILVLLEQESARLGFRTHAYCIMPDHLHFLSEGMEPTSDLLHFVKCIKLKSSRAYAGRLGEVLWQKGYYDHILRPNDPMEDVAWYIWLNPVRKRIVERPEHYPYSGSFTGLQIPQEWGKTEWVPPWQRHNHG